MTTPSARSAATIRSVSRDRSARRTIDGESASAAKGNARLVSDFEPGSATVASTGRDAVGAGHHALEGDWAVTSLTPG